MDVVVTGSSGLIGTALRPALERAGHRMVPMLRGGGGGEALRWDPAQGRIDAGGLEGAGAVVNLAGESIGAKRWSEDQKARIRDSRVRGTTLLAETLAKLNRPPNVLASGSAGGDCRGRGREGRDRGRRPGAAR